MEGYFDLQPRMVGLSFKQLYSFLELKKIQFLLPKREEELDFKLII